MDKPFADNACINVSDHLFRRLDAELLERFDLIFVRLDNGNF